MKIAASRAFAVTRPWKAEQEGSLRLWRRAWEPCANASRALGAHGGAIFFWEKGKTTALFSEGVQFTEESVEESGGVRGKRETGEE